MNLKKLLWTYAALFLLVFAVSLWIPGLLNLGRTSRLSLDLAQSPEFRSQPVNEKLIPVLRGLEDPGEYLAVYWLEHDFKTDSTAFSDREMQIARRRWEKKEGWNSYSDACRAVWNDLDFFPVPSISDSNITVSYEDSWMYERSYKGERGHEGTDLIPSENIRGRIPVASMTDGVVEKKGWLELGGYRIGIRAPHGAYFYYAHLDSYTDIEEGTKIRAGDLLGFMGDTGYSKVEGTSGNFPVHLHIGIYLTVNGKEISVNPYPALRYLDPHITD